MTVILQDDHRKAWLHLIGKKKKFRGTVTRFGHKHRQGQHIQKGATLMLVDVHLVGSSQQIDHAWIDYTIDLAKLGEHVRPNGIIEFEAVVSSYQKGGKNSRTGEVFDDLELSNLKNVTVIKEPFWPKAYEPLQDDSLVSYVIATRSNTKTGKVIGKDPKGQLGSIKAGQGFANKFARKLSWRWSNELPNKYRWQDRL